MVVQKNPVVQPEVSRDPVKQLGLPTNVNCPVSQILESKFADILKKKRTELIEKDIDASKTTFKKKTFSTNNKSKTHVLRRMGMLRVKKKKEKN